MHQNDKLILSYDPLDQENTICTTDLTSMSTNCKLRKINQKTYILRDNFFVKQAIMSGIENIVIYNNDVFNYTYNLTIEFNLSEGREVYSFGGLTSYVILKNERIVTDTTIKTTYNLTCLSGSSKFTKLDYIVPSSNNGLPVTRTLIFY